VIGVHRVGTGAGKSTLLKILSRITERPRARGAARTPWRLPLEVGTGFLLRNLDAARTSNLNGAILGMRRAEISKEVLDAIVEFAEVAKFVDYPVQDYSSGMYSGWRSPCPAHRTEEILLVDEVWRSATWPFSR
jgi:lipopolysaccharide transport system ATP-binding protein